MVCGGPSCNGLAVVDELGGVVETVMAVVYVIFAVGVDGKVTEVNFGINVVEFSVSTSVISGSHQTYLMYEAIRLTATTSRMSNRKTTSIISRKTSGKKSLARRRRS